MRNMGDDLTIPDGAIIETRGGGMVLALRNVLGTYDADVTSFTEDQESASRELARFKAAYRLGWEHCRDAEGKKEKC